MRYRAGLLVLLALVFTGGCAIMSKDTVRKPDERAVRQAKALRPHSEGSLWVDNSKASLFLDDKAAGIGDVLTVKILEMSQGSNTAATDTSRNSSISGSITNLFGLSGAGVVKNFWGKGKPLDLSVDASMTNGYKGAGDTARQQSVTGTVSVLVVDTTPGGNLVVAGKREVTLNREKQIMVISGMVRPEDIAPDNSIFSTQIADARIVYTGSGVISDKQGPGWLMRIIDYVWPF